MTRIAQHDFPVTPDGRYFVVRGRLWRTTNPHLDEATRQHLIKELMQARRLVGAALNQHDKRAERQARDRVNRAKIAPGERGPVWWDESEGDWNQHLATNSPYSKWFAGLKPSSPAEQTH